jgi:hypothetical protein
MQRTTSHTFDVNTDINLPIAVSVDEGQGRAFDERVRRLRHQFEGDGWVFWRIIWPMNEGPRPLFTRPI